MKKKTYISRKHSTFGQKNKNFDGDRRHNDIGNGAHVWKRIAKWKKLPQSQDYNMAEVESCRYRTGVNYIPMKTKTVHY